MLGDVVLEVVTRSVGETLAVGRGLGGCLEGGDVVGLVGVLGAGKTHLMKGIATGLGVADDRDVTSPTFVLVNEYEGRLHVFHLDAYRLSGGDEMASLGFEEMCSAGGVVAVEWADRVAGALPDGALWIELLVEGETDRRLVVRTESAALAARLKGAGLDRCVRRMKDEG